MQEIINHLRGLADGSTKPWLPCCGLCYELAHRFDVDRDDVAAWAANWPECDVDSEFPVGPLGAATYTRFSDGGANMWDPDIYPNDPDHAEYCRARRRLCAWLADYLEERL